MKNKSIIFSTIVLLVISSGIYLYSNHSQEIHNFRNLETNEFKTEVLKKLFFEDLQCKRDNNLYIDVLESKENNTINLDLNQYPLYKRVLKIDFDIKAQEKEEIFDRLLDSEPISFIKASILMALFFVSVIFCIIILYICACYDYCPIIFRDKKQLFFKYKIIFIVITIFIGVNLIFLIYLFNKNKE